ncbi:hypothetical protein DXG03_009291 [Asterophora parasitica]|uniref:Uncharacterized protein n=1 Tax=Asterophora parasitica TaxID=117018 RepID=A0A9P7G1H3_9AGAR|nr:hypothetical protein DXG03_009291 [Asterophora parasitica]
MDAMSLNPPAQPVKKAAAAERIPLPPPPRIPAAKNRRYFYGFTIDDDWLSNHYDQIHHHYPHCTAKASFVTKWLVASSHLEFSSGYRPLTVESVSHDVRKPDVLVDSRGWLYLVSVCSNLRSSYERRPNQKQMDKLKAIFGKEPSWYVDWHDAEYYEED